MGLTCILCGTVGWARPAGLPWSVRPGRLVPFQVSRFLFFKTLWRTLVNRKLSSAGEEEVPDYHALLVELQQITRGGRNKERYDTLFCQLSERMFQDFWGYCEKQVRYLTANRYYVSINETEDILQEVLIKIFRKIDSYRGTCDPQARAWIGQIICRTVQDSSKTSRRRGGFWEWAASMLRLWGKRSGESRRSDD